VAEPRLIAEGRASEILDLGGGRVLRRFKAGGSPEREALVMGHARARGYPVPEVFEVDADSLVIERIEGPTMLEAVFERSSALAEQARLLAELHDDLHRIEAPDGLLALGEGDRLVHLDLHPENVILSPAGPVVIDWANARRGHGLLDVAYTWIICATSSGVGQLGLDFVELFLAHFDRDEALRHLPLAVEHRLADPNVLDEERVRIRALAAEQPSAAGS
jgi:aminoglycoside phosphotransferase (APT) family kinase protein